MEITVNVLENILLISGILVNVGTVASMIFDFIKKRKKDSHDIERK